MAKSKYRSISLLSMISLVWFGMLESTYGSLNEEKKDKNLRQRISTLKKTKDLDNKQSMFDDFTKARKSCLCGNFPPVDSYASVLPTTRNGFYRSVFGSATKTTIMKPSNSSQVHGNNEKLDEITTEDTNSSFINQINQLNNALQIAQTENKNIGLLEQSLGLLHLPHFYKQSNMMDVFLKQQLDLPQVIVSTMEKANSDLSAAIRSWKQELKNNETKFSSSSKEKVADLIIRLRKKHLNSLCNILNKYLQDQTNNALEALNRMHQLSLRLDYFVCGDINLFAADNSVRDTYLILTHELEISLLSSMTATCSDFAGIQSLIQSIKEKFAFILHIPIWIAGLNTYLSYSVDHACEVLLETAAKPSFCDAPNIQQALLDPNPTKYTKLIKNLIAGKSVNEADELLTKMDKSLHWCMSENSVSILDLKIKEVIAVIEQIRRELRLEQLIKTPNTRTKKQQPVMQNKPHSAQEKVSELQNKAQAAQKTTVTSKTQTNIAFELPLPASAQNKPNVAKEKTTASEKPTDVSKKPAISQKVKKVGGGKSHNRCADPIPPKRTPT